MHGTLATASAHRPKHVLYDEEKKGVKTDIPMDEFKDALRELLPSDGSNKEYKCFEEDGADGTDKS